MSFHISDSSYEDWVALKKMIQERSSSWGIDQIGFATADPFLNMKQILFQHREKGYESGFEEPDIAKRVYPELSLEQPQSILSIALAYPAKLQNPPRQEPGAYRGVISRSAWGEDYHRVLHMRLERLASFIHEQVQGARTHWMVDTGALVDRAVAERAGIGWVGKNCAVISEKYGSWIYLGEMITNVPFPADTPVQDQCGTCTRCLDACPTGALVGPGQLNAKACISFITQTKSIVSDELKLKIGNRLYGCDTCQIVCPKNKGLNWTHQPEFQPNDELVKPLLLPLLNLSNQQFKKKYGHSAAAWRGKTPIQRNAILALGHFKDKSAIPKLVELLFQDKREVIRATAAWALARIGTISAIEAIQKALQTEQSEQVRSELNRCMTASSIVGDES